VLLIAGPKNLANRYSRQLFARQIVRGEDQPAEPTPDELRLADITTDAASSSR
jgi:hypothetical protein